MSDEIRVKRPALERKEPIRSFLHFAAPPGTEAGAASEESPVARAVDLGYRVVDEYIRQGERAARRGSDPLLRPGAFTGVQDLGARMMQYASDFAGAWFELWGLTATGDAGRAPFPFAPRPPAQPEAAPAAPPPPRAERTRVAVEVSSLRPAIVAVDLREGAAERPLVVHELRAPSAELPRLSDVAFVPASPGRPGRLRVRVPADHPAGVYSGAVIDLETSVPAGTVCVTLE